MNKEKPIIIKENGKIINKRSEPNLASTKREVAATLHESDEPLQVIEKSNIREVPLKKKRKNTLLKPIFIAVSSAVIIGAVLSVVMFQFLLDVENTGGEGLNGLPVSGQTENNEKETTDTSNSATTTSFTLDPLQGYIIQAGVFSEQENAENWAGNFSNIGLSTVIWQRSDQYFLLLGLAETKEEASSIANGLDTGDLEVYVKEWSTLGGEVQVTESEKEWLQLFQGVWNENLNNVDNLSLDNWQELRTGIGKDSEKLAPLLQYMNEDPSSGELGQQSLLHLMYEYEKIVGETGS